MSQKVNNPDNTIAFQGIPGAYSEMACLSNFNTCLLYTSDAADDL